MTYSCSTSQQINGQILEIWVHQGLVMAAQCKLHKIRVHLYPKVHHNGSFTKMVIVFFPVNDSAREGGKSNLIRLTAQNANQIQSERENALIVSVYLSNFTFLPPWFQHSNCCSLNLLSLLFINYLLTSLIVLSISEMKRKRLL